MEEISGAKLYRLWGADDVIYGPVDAATMNEWIADDRITFNSWIFSETEQRWARATDLMEFGSLLPVEGQGDIDRSGTTPAKTKAITAGALRRVKILGDLSDSGLERLVRHVEVITVPQFKEIVRKGQADDSLFMVLEGELRVRLLIDDKETILQTIGVGDVFGEVSVFDHGPRSADVVANVPSTLLRLSQSGLQSLIARAPELAAPMMLSLGKTLAGRIRADNRRLQESISIARASNAHF